MFERFNNSARAVALRAHDNAVIEGSRFIEPRHILIALRELHPELFAGIAVDPDEQELKLMADPTGMPQGERKVRFSNRSKRALLTATKEGHLSSLRRDVDERHLLLGLLGNPDCLAVALLIKRGLNPEAVRQHLRITAKR